VIPARLTAARRGALLAVGLVAAAPASARAGSLRWEAPDGCPDQAEVEARIARSLGGPLSETSLDAAVRIDRQGDQLVATIALGEAPERALAATSCAAVVDAIAVIVARAAREVGRRPPPPVEAPSGLPVVRAPWNDPADPEHAPGTPRSTATLATTFGARLSAIAGAGTLPGLDGGGEATVTLGLGRVEVEVGAARWRSSTAATPATASGAIDVALTTAVGRLAYRLAPRWRAEPACWAVGELGTVRGAPSGTSMSVRGTWSALGLGAGVALPLAPHLAGVLGVEALAPLWPTRFVSINQVVLHQPATLTVRLTAGVAVSF
jgi:hypothetical protein